MALDQTGATATISLNGLNTYAAALIDGGVYWDTTQAGTAGTVIHWAKDSSWGGYFDTLNSIFSAWSAVADVTFQPVNNTRDAEIVLTRTSDALGGYGGYAGVPFRATGDYIDPFVNETVAHLGQVNVFIHNNGNLANSSNPTFDNSGNITPAGVEEIMHEIGHALGLKHPDDAGASVTPIYFPGVQARGDHADFQFNDTRYTIMADYFGVDDSGALEIVSTPMAFDIAAIQTLYGANMTTHAGDDVYVLPDPSSATTWTCIWDTGGTDWISYSGTAHAVIDLRAATLNDTADGGGHLSYTYNINPDGSRTLGLGGTIAGDVLGVLPDEGTEHGVVIENAHGGSNDDSITGNGADNVLSGNGGSDVLMGLDGNDTLEGGAGNDTLVGGRGIDTAVYSHQFGQSFTIDLQEGFLAQGFALSSNGDRDTLDGIENVVASLGDDVITGNAHDNTFSYIGSFTVTSNTGGIDTYTGGGGNDTVDFSGFDGALDVDLRIGQATSGFSFTGGGSGRLVAHLSGIQNVVASLSDDTIVGDAHDNTFTYIGSFTPTSNTGGIDTYTGGGGHDTVDFSRFDGGVFVDSRVDGGVFVDLRDGEVSSSWLVITGPTSGSGSARLVAHLSGIQNVVASFADDTIIGDFHDNTFAYIGSFTPTSDTGGFDTYTSGGGNDTVDFSRFDGSLFVTLGNGEARASWTVSEPGGGITGAGSRIAQLTGIENVVAGAQDDTLVGDANDNTFTYVGSFTPTSNTGGIDTYTGGGGNDTVDFSRFDGAIDVDLGIGQAGSGFSVVNGGSARLVAQLTGIQNVVGGAANDTIVGNAQDNVITGGAGRDTFVLGQGGHDTVTDFEVRTSSGIGDVLDLSHVAGLTSLAQLTQTDTPDGEMLQFAGNTILLEGITVGHLTAENFVFARKVGDGYVSGATVFADANGNGLLDAGEASATTDQTGTFSLTDEVGTLIAFGGIDTSTGLALKAQLSAPEFSIAITPLTTLLTAGVDQGRLNAALGLPADFDVTIMDPIAALRAGDADSAKVFVAGAKVMDTVIAFGAEIAALGGNEAAAQHAAFATIAAAMNGLGAGATLDLANGATLAGLFTTLAQHEGIDGSPVASALGAAVAASNATIDQRLTQDGASDALITDTGAVQAAIQANHPPHAVNDFAAATAGIGGTASADAAHGVLANDSDPDGDPLTVTGFSGGTHGTLLLNQDGSYRYTVTDLTGPTGSHLHDVFTYSITDGHAGVAVATLDITLNRAPTLGNESTAVVKGGTISGNVLANDSDPDGDAIALTGVTGGTLGHSIAGTYGSFTLNANGSYTYVANKGGLPSQIVPQDTFTYTISDGHGGSTTATASVVVLSPSQSYQAGTNTTLNGGNGPDVLDGSSGHHVLLGGNGADVLIGGVGDTLTGGNGPDTFLFRPDFGANTITDFDVNNDVVQIDTSVFPGGLSDLLAHTSDSAAGAVITDLHGDTITFTGVTSAQLHQHASDFHIV